MVKTIFIDNLPLKSGHAVRGMGMYTRNLLEYVKKDLKNDKKFQFDETNYDLIHYPYFDLFFNTLNHNSKSKFIVTIPDVIPLIYPKHYPSAMKGKLNFFKQKNSLKKASAIVTISETSKKDIVRLLDVGAEKIFVTYLAPNFKFKRIRIKKNKFKLPEKFVLYVGDVNYNKNLLTLVIACKEAKQKLVIVGKQAINQDYDKAHIENQPLRELQEKYGDDKDVIKLGFLSNEDLNEVWNLATIYCQPSLYEGFGLPVLEAMQAGVPVIASRTQALVEVAENAAMYFDSNNHKELSRKIKYLTSSKKVRNNFIKKGNLRVKDFSWPKTASQTVNVYKRVLSSKKD